MSTIRKQMAVAVASVALGAVALSSAATSSAEPETTPADPAVTSASAAGPAKRPPRKAQTMLGSTKSALVQHFNTYGYNEGRIFINPSIFNNCVANPGSCSAGLNNN